MLCNEKYCFKEKAERIGKKNQTSHWTPIEKNIPVKTKTDSKF